MVSILCSVLKNIKTLQIMCQTKILYVSMLQNFNEVLTNFLFKLWLNLIIIHNINRELF